MGKIKINLDDAKPPESITPGPYLFEVIKAEQTVAKESDTEMIAWTCEVTEEGKFKGRKLRHQSVLVVDPIKDPDGEKTKFSQYMLRTFLESCRFVWDPDGFDPDTVVGSKFVGEVVTTVDSGREYSNLQKTWAVTQDQKKK